MEIILSHVQDHYNGFIGLFILFLFLYWRSGSGSRLISNDDRTLTSTRLRLSGRPDRITALKSGEWIPIEKKSSLKLRDSHRIQLGVYLILIEEETKKRPPYGLIILGDNQEIKIKNTEKLRKETLRHIKAVQTQKKSPQSPVKATAFPAKCRSCGFKNTCDQSAA